MTVNAWAISENQEEINDGCIQKLCAKKGIALSHMYLGPFPQDALCPAWRMVWLALTVSQLGCVLSVGQCIEVAPRVKRLCERHELLTVDGLFNKAADQQRGDLQI